MLRGTSTTLAGTVSSSTACASSAVDLQQVAGLDAKGFGRLGMQDKGSRADMLLGAGQR